MILRNVIVASDLERLRPVRAAGLAALSVAADLREPMPVCAEARPAAASLTLELVCDWLTAQSPEVRAACASHLAPDIELSAERAREIAREIGRAEGRQQALEDVRSSLGALTQLAAECEQAFAHECTQLTESCTEIVAEVFAKLAGSALVSREAVLGAVLEVVRRAKDERELTIQVNAQDLPFLQSQGSAIQEALGARSWSLSADPRVTLGGCLIESSLGTLDGRLETQLQELFETLRATKTAAVEDA